MTFGMKISDFHIESALLDFAIVAPWNSQTRYTYTFYNHFHPYVGELIDQLNRNSIRGLLDPVYHETELVEPFFEASYAPTDLVASQGEVDVKYYNKNIDVQPEGPYSIYNWEMLFHAPLSIAVHLSKNQRFAEAQRWFHYIFDPTIGTDERLGDADPRRFWRFLGFRTDEKVRQIDELLALLSKPDSECDDDEKVEKDRIKTGYDTLLKDPFQPHAVARTRLIAYQYSVVMKYLDNLIDWGDSLFRQDTIESINEAMLLYILAANILGPRPQEVPNRGITRPMTFAELRRKEFDRVGNVMVDLEGKFPFALYSPSVDGAGTDKACSLFGIGRVLYFCIPKHDGLLGYWDTVADRLFKIRHCMNIEGIVRQLPLFQPPIDPGMLVKAAAAGIDISSLVSGLNQPLSPVRAALMIQKAIELCSEVRSMGDRLLSALEKRSAEKLSLLRQEQEIRIQRLTQDVRFLQWKEAEAATDALLESRKTTVDRFLHYLRLLGVESEDTPERGLALSREALTEENFDETFAQLVGQYETDIEPLEPLDLGIEESSPYLSENESDEISHLKTARDTGLAASIASSLASAFAPVPDADVDLHYWGIGGKVKLNVGTALVAAARIAGDVLGMIAAWEREQAGIASRTASYERRADDWIFQSNQAAQELMHIGRQIISSLIREQLARHEYELQKRRIEQAQEIDAFLRDKFTSEELYGWMQGELSKLFYEYYKFAFDIARKAEQTMKHELMRPELDDVSFVKFNYWDGGRKGLLSGEALHLDLKRMEMAYHDHNKREYELTKHVSIAQLNPLALLELKATGSCEVTVPEWLFDLDCSGHYMRRIKSVGLTIPSVVGPYTSINCTLALQRSSLRKSPLLTDGEYGRQGSEDPRFVDYYGTIQSVVTSNANNDAGMFEPNLRDERFLPFEGAGAVSHWKLELPARFRQFDYDTISDVILHIRYTARRGIPVQNVVESLEARIGEVDATGLVRLLSLRHDFPSQWASFAEGGGDEPFGVVIRRRHFPYIAVGRDLSISGGTLYAVGGKEVLSREVDGPEIDWSGISDALNGDAQEAPIELAKDDEVLKRDKEAEVFLLLRYTIPPKG